jgi:FAD synthase
MQIIEWSQFLKEPLLLTGSPSAITVGVFDGVHRGHRLLIDQVVMQKECAASSAVPVVITFMHRHHKKNSSDGHSGDILSFRQKMAILESLGVSVAIVIEFSEVRHMKGLEFLRILHEHSNMGFMAVGSNFRCGYHLDTDAPAIQDFNARQNIPTCIVQPLKEGSQAISSRLIRAATPPGPLREAAAMPGRPVTVDLGAAAVSPATDGTAAYDIAAQGRILPPPGSYPVLLIGKNADRSAGKTAQVQVAGGSIVIGTAVHGAGVPDGWQYVEFC